MHDRGLVESFGVTKRFDYLPEGEIRDYVVILGVNAISAEDGEVFFLQHMSNISHDLQQAKKIILVVGLEKVMRDRETALFHTRSMGIFGLESILLDLKPNELEKFDFDALPVLTDQPERSIEVIVLDNGRSKLLKSVYEDLFLCIDCRNCARQCPIGLHVFFERGLVYSPKNYLMGYLQGYLPPVDACLHCGRCHVECPVEIDIPTLIWKAQLGHYEYHKRSLKKRMLDDPEMLAKMGSLAAPLSNWMTNLGIVKYMTELFTGVHHKSNLRRSIKRRSETGSRKEEVRVADKIVYYHGCFANYYNPDMGKSLVEVMKKNGFEVIVPEQKCLRHAADGQ